MTKIAIFHYKMTKKIILNRFKNEFGQENCLKLEPNSFFHAQKIQNYRFSCIQIFSGFNIAGKEQCHFILKNTKKIFSSQFVTNPECSFVNKGPRHLTRSISSVNKHQNLMIFF
jgi:hypothetical protein